MSVAKVIFRAEPTDRLISTVLLGGWSVQTFEDPQGRQYQIMTPPQPKEDSNDDN